MPQREVKTEPAGGWGGISTPRGPRARPTRVPEGGPPPPPSVLQGGGLALAHPRFAARSLPLLAHMRGGGGAHLRPCTGASGRARAGALRPCPRLTPRVTALTEPKKTHTHPTPPSPRDCCPAAWPTHLTRTPHASPRTSPQHLRRAAAAPRPQARGVRAASWRRPRRPAQETLCLGRAGGSAGGGRWGGERSAAGPRPPHWLGPSGGSWRRRRRRRARRAGARRGAARGSRPRRRLEEGAAAAGSKMAASWAPL